MKRPRSSCRQFFFSLILFFFLGTVSCVSVNIGPTAGKKSEDVSFQIPENPFKLISTDNADKAWQSQKTGNTLAFLSECKGSVDLPLKTIEGDSVNALNQPVLVSSQTGLFNDRGSLETTADGFVDGVEVRMALMIFKKNSCNYTISYVGRKKTFDQEKTHFDKFLKGFKAP